MDEEMIRNYTMGVQDDSGFIEDTIHPIVDKDQDVDENQIIIKSNKGEKRVKMSEPDSDRTLYSEHVYRKKFIWPESYVHRESRKESEPMEPLNK